MLEEVLALPQSQGALTVVCSDHGHGPVHELVRINGLLADLGFLTRGGAMAQARDAWRRISGQRKQKGLGIAVEWPKTKAYMPFEAIAGFIFLNRAGREPYGVVNEAETSGLTKQILEALRAQKSPHSGKPLFDNILTADDAYPQRGPFDAPELFALAARGFNFVRKLSFGPSIEVPEEKHKGTHRPEGFFALAGPGVKPAMTAEASISDLAPTLLAALGEPVPSDMTGRVLSDFFQEGLAFSSGPPSSLDASGGANVYSDAEKAAVEQRLADLGYVD
jgi:predicted AlkP superfamily phosphohydrolase/phosphomutase